MLQIAHAVLIRHGEIDRNRERRLQGQLDTPLNTQGLEQVAQLDKVLAHERSNAVYASDLSRVRQAARALVGEMDVSMRNDVSLCERCYDQLEGLTYAGVAARYPDDSDAWQNHVPGSAPLGGEAFAEFHKRAVETTLRLIRRRPGEYIMLANHDGALGCLYRYTNTMTLTEPHQHGLRNTSIDQLSSDGHQPTVLQWRDVAHLDLLVFDEADRRVP